MVEGADEQIVRIKSKKANSILAKLVNEASNAIYIRLRDRNYPALVKILIGLQDNIDDWKNAPLWTKKKITKATKTWFKMLK